MPDATFEGKIQEPKLKGRPLIIPVNAEASRFYLTGGGLSDVYRESVVYIHTSYKLFLHPAPGTRKTDRENRAIRMR